MIPLMKNHFLNEDQTRKALSEFVLNSDRLSMGEQCTRFEKEFARYQHRQDMVLFNSGGSANLAIMQSLKNLGKLQEGDRIGFSALTWATNVMPIIQTGMKPVPIDCDPLTINVMSHNLRERLNSVSIKALFITNALGLIGDLNIIRDICREQNIILLEDNCESLGTELPAGKAGNFGYAASFSFYVAHHMSTIEGGMVGTDDEEFAEMLKIVRANGWDRNLNAAQQHKWRSIFNISNEFEAQYAFYDLGYNLRPTEITGFLGMYQLKFIEENIRVRESNYRALEAKVKENPDLMELDHRHIARLSSFAFPVLCKDTGLKSKYLSKFVNAGVEIRPMIAGNIQRQPFYLKYAGAVYDLPGTDFIDKCGFYCGNYPELTRKDLEVLGSCLQQ